MPPYKGSSERNSAEGPEIYTALRRKLKNRHITMIRYVPSVLTIPRPTAPADCHSQCL